jgi:protocatechuate 4,5-dioxygenase alpha subunit
MTESQPYDDIPGTILFDAERSRQGYHLNMFCMSLMKDENRKAFRADEAAYLQRFPMTPEQREVILKRDWNGMLELGGNIYYTAKLAATDDAPVIALNLPTAKLSPAMSAYFKKCQDRLGFVPNVLLAYAFDMAKLESFVAMYNDLMLGDSGLSKLEREMIAVAVSSQNRCYYCLTAHGAAVRQYSGNPLLGEQIVMNYRVARINRRQRAMLDFAVKLTVQPWSIEETDRERLRRAGFSDRDIWDIAAVAGFFNMSNRVASASDMRPNTVYHGQVR